MAECAGALGFRLNGLQRTSRNQPLNRFVIERQGLIVVCVKLFLLLGLLGQFYFCAFQLLGHSRNVLLVNVCRH